MASSSSRAATSASTAGSDKERPRNSICRGHRPRRRDRKKICRRCPPEDLRKRVVLVVEDEPKLRKVAVKMLDRLGLQSMQAETAKDALEFLADRHIDVLFTDIELPGGMTGRNSPRRRASWTRSSKCCSPPDMPAKRFCTMNGRRK